MTRGCSYRNLVYSISRAFNKFVHGLSMRNHFAGVSLKRTFVHACALPSRRKHLSFKCLPLLPQNETFSFSPQFLMQNYRALQLFCYNGKVSWQLKYWRALVSYDIQCYITCLECRQIWPIVFFLLAKILPRQSSFYVTHSKIAASVAGCQIYKIR